MRPCGNSRLLYWAPRPLFRGAGTPRMASRGGCPAQKAVQHVVERDLTSSAHGTEAQLASRTGLSADIMYL